VNRTVWIVLGITVVVLLVAAFLSKEIAMFIGLIGGGASVGVARSKPAVEKAIEAVEKAEETLDDLPAEVAKVREAVVTEDYLEPLDLS
jgi:hypothetical protein